MLAAQPGTKSKELGWGTGPCWGLGLRCFPMSGCLQCNFINLIIHKAPPVFKTEQNPKLSSHTPGCEQSRGNPSPPFPPPFPLLSGECSGLQEPLRNKVEVLEGGLLVGAERAAGSGWCQSRWQCCELALKVSQVCGAAEGGHEGGLDSSGQQGLPVGGLWTKIGG